MTGRSQRPSAVERERRPLRVRYAEPAEYDDVAALLLRANQEFRRAMPAPVYRAYRENLRALVLDPRHHDVCEILVADRCAMGGRLLGAITFFPDAAEEKLGWPRGWAGLRALAVKPTARGLGIGRQLVETAIGRARSIGAPVICLHSAAFQSAARSLYLDLGFSRCPQFDFDAGSVSGEIPAASANSRPIPIEAFTMSLR